MKEKLLFLVSVLCSCAAFSQAPAVEWQKSFGGTQEEDANCVLQTADGGFIIAGTAGSNDGDCISNHGAWDYFVVKTDSAGEVMWKKCYGGSNSDKAKTMIKTNDGGYLIGGETNSNDGDVTGNTLSILNSGNWLVKIDQSGNILWQTFMPIPGEVTSEIRSIHENVGGGFTVTGNTYFPNGGNGYGDIYMAKISAEGTYNPNDNVIIGGGFNDDVNDMKATNDGGYILVGNSNSSDGLFSGTHNPTPANIDLWTVKLNADFVIEWLHLFGGTSNEQAFSIEQTTDNGYIILGNTDSIDGDITLTHGGAEYWLLKLDSAGIIEWQKTYGGTGNEEGFSLKKTTDGGFTLLGRAGSTDGDVTASIGNWDYWLLKVTNLGEIEWQKSMGGTGTDYGLAMNLNADGSLILAGNSWPFDEGENGNHGYWDFLVVKLSASPLNSSTFENHNLILYPNPVSTKLNVQSNQTLLNKLIVCDVSGKIILEQKENLNAINTENLAAGIYFLKGFTEDKVLINKFIKQ